LFILTQLNSDIATFVLGTGVARCFDLTAPQIERLGGFYVANSGEVTQYHSPETGYGFAFGQNRDRYDILFISLTTGRLYHRNHTMSEFRQLNS